MTTDLQRAMALAPGVVRPSWRVRAGRAAVLILSLAALAAMALDLGIDPGSIGAGLDKLGRFVGHMFPPNDGGDPTRIVRALAETFAMAFAGTFLAAVAALPLGVAGAKSVVGHPILHFAFRRALDVFRGVPALVWALIFVAAFGLGPFGGVLALAIADLPGLAKLYAEAIENVDEKPIDGLRSAGAAPPVVLRYGLLPQVTPIMASQTLFYLESNFRNAAVLGIVGAGGIGFELEERIRVFAFDEVAFIVILYVICVAALDTFSQRLRQRLG
ncbi:phosphonate ABC transporter, permease protein PhnE [Phenylobacterium sp.]|jgi:phosphonate transport system permease protein|uniref:phosphonate ABC transporter, permease protein PhnE n=1 Tax=Phenylobacterium sp. TaxID=1871053 RepID=UPI0037C6C96E